MTWTKINAKTWQFGKYEIYSPKRGLWLAPKKNGLGQTEHSTLGGAKRAVENHYK